MKTLLKILLTIIISAVAIVIAMQGVTKIYQNPTIVPFAGDKFYNPYAVLDSASWNSGFRKADFHAHTRWDVNGSYTTDEFEQAYIYSGYDIIGIADHNYITTDLSDRPGYIPTYEHGYGLHNYHILVLGAGEVDILDHPFMLMPRQQMQYAIDRLAKQCRAVSINHPERIRMISQEDIARLRGFRLMEINPDAQTQFWDNTLSAGNYVTLVGSDDAHSITNRNSWFQRAFTMVCPKDTTAEGIITALEDGQAYAVTVTTKRNATGSHTQFPRLTNFKMQGDTLSVALSEQADQITFIGNGSEKLLSLIKVNKAQYVIPQNINYVRVKAEMPNGVTIYTNPTARSNDGLIPPMLPMPDSVAWLTVLNSIAWPLLALILLLVTLIPLWRKKQKKLNFEHTMWGAGQKPYDLA